MPGKASFDSPLVLITGANGWLGGRVIEAIVEGLESTSNINTNVKAIRALIPAGENADKLQERGVDIIVGDIRDDQARRFFFKSTEGATLIHLAGIIHPSKVSEFVSINTQGTIDLIAAAKQANLRRAVVMSSNSPVGCNPHPDHRFTEDSPYNPYMGYGYSKWLMEVALRQEMASSSPLEIVIARAPWFYGPNQPPRQTLFFQMIRDGKFPIVGNGSNRRSMGYTDSLAQGLLLCAAHPKAAGEIFWLADEIPYSMNEIVETVRLVLRDDFKITVKESTLRLPGIVGDIATVVDRSLQSVGMYNQKIHVLSEMNKTIACEISKAQRVLGYFPEIRLKEGMRRSIEWCLKSGQLI